MINRKKQQEPSYLGIIELFNNIVMAKNAKNEAINLQKFEILHINLWLWAIFLYFLHSSSHNLLKIITTSLHSLIFSPEPYNVVISKYSFQRI